MKTRKLFATSAIALTTMALTLTSCLKDDGTDLDALVPNAVVTVKPSGDSFFLQLDDNTVLYPSNITKSPFGDKEVRAFTNYKEEGKKDDKQMIHVNWMKELLTKQTDATKGSEEAVSAASCCIFRCKTASSRLSRIALISEIILFTSFDL